MSHMTSMTGKACVSVKLSLCINMHVKRHTINMYGSSVMRKFELLCNVHEPRQHKVTPTHPHFKCMPYRASVGVDRLNQWMTWHDTWPVLGKRKREEAVSGVILMTVTADAPDCLAAHLKVLKTCWNPMCARWNQKLAFWGPPVHVAKRLPPVPQPSHWEEYVLWVAENAQPPNMQHGWCIVGYCSVKPDAQLWFTCNRSDKCCCTNVPSVFDVLVRESC
eukprot:5852223-Amphidinium_carterae.1